MKNWENKVLELLSKSLNSIPVELNEMDWKQNLSPNKDRLAELYLHLQTIREEDILFLALKILQQKYLE